VKLQLMRCFRVISTSLQSPPVVPRLLDGSLSCRSYEDFIIIEDLMYFSRHSSAVVCVQSVFTTCAHLCPQSAATNIKEQLQVSI
jgi:hypothetical protein